MLMSRVLRGVVGAVLAGTILAAGAPAASADVSFAVTPSVLAGQLAVGDRVPGTLTIVNQSGDDEADGGVTLGSITVTLSCGTGAAGPDGCPPADFDPGLLAFSGPATGAAGTACAGTTFTPQPSAPTSSGSTTTPAAEDPAEYQLVPSTPVTLGSPAGTASPESTVTTQGTVTTGSTGSTDTCVIDYSLDVLEVPSKDAESDAPGLQTEQAASAQGTATDAVSGSGSGETVLTIGPGNVSIATQPSAESFGLGDSFREIATLEPAGDSLTPPTDPAPPTGTISFAVYGPGDASCSETPVFSSTEMLSGSGLGATSNAFEPTTLGTYRVIASYSGDDDYQPATSSCSDSRGSVDVETPVAEIATKASPSSLSLGASFRDTATLTSSSGGPPPTGSVDFAVYGPGDATCSEPPVFSSNVPLTQTAGADASLTSPSGSNGSPATPSASKGSPTTPSGAAAAASGGASAATSGAYRPTTTGDYRVVVAYPGDVNYAPARSSCEDPAALVVVGPTTRGGPLANPVVGSATTPGQGPDGNPGGSASAGSPGAGPAAPAGGPGSGSGAPGGPTVTSPAGSQAGAGASAGPPGRGGGSSTPPGVAKPARASQVSDARSRAKKVIAIEVAAFTLLTMGGGQGFALAGAALARSAGRRRAAVGRELSRRGVRFDDGAEVDERDAEVMYLAAREGFGPGDRSGTWRWPGTRALDRASVVVPSRLATWSPLLTRVVDDGAYLRSIFGSITASLPVVGLGLGIVAVNQTGGRATAPGLILTAGIAVLGVIDAASGLLAVVVFVGGVVVLGGLDSTGALRALLDLGALWFVVPVVAGAARPLRRDPPSDFDQRFDRAADFAIASLIGAWAVQSLVDALPILSGHRLAIASHADAIAGLVLAGLVVRMLAETLAARFYPRRLITVEPQTLGEPGRAVGLVSVGLRTGVFVLIATVAVHGGWQLYAAAGLLVVPQVLAVYRDRLPESKTLAWTTPHGLFEIALLLFLLTGLGTLLLDRVSTSLIADSFVLLAVPGAILVVLHQFAGEESERTPGWVRRIGGLILLIAGVLQVLGLLF
jgi:hypothetical protein